jgi:hypothetical protein
MTTIATTSEKSPIDHIILEEYSLARLLSFSGQTKGVFQTRHD